MSSLSTIVKEATFGLRVRATHHVVAVPFGSRSSNLAIVQINIVIEQVVDAHCDCPIIAIFVIWS